MISPVNVLNERPKRIMDVEETLYVDTRAPACDGGGALGHPKIYLKIGPEGETVCPYCSRRFVLSEGAKEAVGH